MDINHFLGIPGLSFNIMLKISKVKLELISNPKICNFFRNSIRGGMSFIVTRRAKSDYIDSNVDNLFGCIICERNAKALAAS